MSCENVNTPEKYTSWKNIEMLFGIILPWFVWVKNFQSQSDGGPCVNHVIHNNTVLAGYFARYLQELVNHLVSQTKFLWGFFLNMNNFFAHVVIRTTYWCFSWCRGWSWFCAQSLLVSANNTSKTMKNNFAISSPIMDHGKIQSKIIRNHDGSLSSPLIRRHNDAVLPIADVLLDPIAE